MLKCKIESVHDRNKLQSSAYKLFLFEKLLLWKLLIGLRTAASDSAYQHKRVGENEDRLSGQLL